MLNEILKKILQRTEKNTARQLGLKLKTFEIEDEDGQIKNL